MAILPSRQMANRWEQGRRFGTLLFPSLSRTHSTTGGHHDRVAQVLPQAANGFRVEVGGQMFGEGGVAVVKRELFQLRPDIREAFDEPVAKLARRLLRLGFDALISGPGSNGFIGVE